MLRGGSGRIRSPGFRAASVRDILPRGHRPVWRPAPALPAAPRRGFLAAPGSAAAAGAAMARCLVRRGCTRSVALEAHDRPEPVRSRDLG